MAWMPYRTSIVCARLAALCIALAILGCVVDWFRDGAIGVVSIVVLGLAGLILAAAAHRFSKRSV